MKEKIISLKRNEEGVAAAEYALLLALIIVTTAAVATVLSNAICGAISKAATALISS